MPKFLVQVQQYVEFTTSIEVEAETPEEAREEVLDLDPSYEGQDTWTRGDDAYDADVWAVCDEAGNIVWER